MRCCAVLCCAVLCCAVLCSLLIWYKLHQMLYPMLIYVHSRLFVTLLREAKEDAVSTVAFSDSFKGGNSGTLSYHLASADLCATRWSTSLQGDMHIPCLHSSVLSEQAATIWSFISGIKELLTGLLLHLPADRVSCSRQVARVG